MEAIILCFYLPFESRSVQHRGSSVSSGLTIISNTVIIGFAHKLPPKYKIINTKGGNPEKVYAKQKTRFNLFRLFLNEAISFAKKHGLKEVRLFPQNDTLREYFKTFGFDNEGVFRIKKQQPKIGSGD